jgi:membrane-associated protease RseP (regulator of RpoE activity)
MDVTVELGEYSRNVIIREFETKFPRLFPRDEERLEERFAFPREVTPESFFPRRKYIGVYLDELNEELAKYFGAEEGTGLLITKLTKDGPAEKAGLRVGDVIVKADGERVKSLQDLTRQIHKKDKNEEIEIEYIRDKKKNTVKVKVDEEKDQGVFFVPSERSRIGIVTDEPFFSPRYKYEDRLKSQSEKQFLYEDVFKNILDKSQKKLYRLQEEQGDSYRKLFEDFSKMNGGSPEKSYTQAMKWYRGIIV